jgi:hypothetical protein
MQRGMAPIGKLCASEEAPSPQPLEVFRELTSMANLSTMKFILY